MKSQFLHIGNQIYIIKSQKLPASSYELFPDCLNVTLFTPFGFFVTFTISRGYWGPTLAKGQNPIPRTPTDYYRQ